jgi:hypothetical protein
MSGTLRRIGAIGLEWAGLWLTAMMILGLIIAGVDPDSIDPGEGPVGAGVIIGPMGFLSGIAFATILRIGGELSASRVSLARATTSGFLGSAIAQVPYLGHGDRGLAANVQMALMFAAFGAVVAMVWLVVGRWWSRRPSSTDAGGNMCGHHGAR